ncbi:helix-turn-helix transcriptional regulator [Paenibacillus spongiae]|uniref:AraC family transcriptional regulator n=1 Tax=Paenibacillus spongiae TaxID=2909671 RepID=A0ABY5SI11_9BACL|nr:AraC family transcriptional regulator [Paenibacillus spongiae]UVI33095.1 AraC family transcriptional regulator [Paenibacillus spongiae]
MHGNRPMDSFGNYLANIQTGILVSSYGELGAAWSYPNVKDDFNRLYFMVDGRCRIRVNGLQLTPSAGHLILLPAGADISAESYNGERFAKYFCHFTAAIGGSRLFDLLHTSRSIEVRDTSLIEEQFQELNRHFSGTGITSALRAKTALNLLLCYFIENNPTVTLHEYSHPSIQRMTHVLEYIDKHLADKLTVEDLAKLVHFHPHYFIPMFRTMMGCSPMQYIAKLRFERAATLLLSTKLNMNEIADYVGIHPEYFTKFFKHHGGVSPTEFRNCKFN